MYLNADSWGKKNLTPYTIFFYICLAVVLYAGI